MADLTIMDTTLHRMDTALVEAEKVKPPRDYLGMSEIGDSCARKLWLNYHTDRTSTASAQGLRIFGMGDLIETRIVRDLRRAGIKVNRSAKGNTYLQTVYSSKKTSDNVYLPLGRFMGHSDGRVKGLPESSREHILEAKSCNDKSYKAFVKDGVEGHKTYGAKYTAQVQCYMGVSGIHRALFIIENKNTSERYMERVYFNQRIFTQLKAKAKAIIEATTPPSGISDRPDWYECKFCSHNNEV